MIKSGQYLGQKQSMQQKLSPQQIQYIKLLQLPTVAMEKRIKEEMEENPLLEEGDELEEFDNLQESEEIEKTEDDEVDPVDENEEIDWEEFSHEDEIDSYKTGNYNPDREEWRDLPNPYHETLLEQLENQVALLDFNKREKLIAKQILGSLDADGYFRRDMEALIDNIAFNHGMLVTEEEVEKVRKRVQNLDPPGMASVDLQDCLLVQLKKMPEHTKGRSNAIDIVGNHWDAFKKKHFSKLKQRLDLDDEELKAAYACVTKLDPKPGAGGDSPTNNKSYIEPDFEVYFQPSEDDENDNEGEFIISLNSKNVPPLRISPDYKEMWDELKRKKKKKEHDETKKTRKFIKNKIESARWFIECIRQRQNTLMSVMKTIVALQEDFFKYGKGLKPMILKDIAERVQLDISTISRVVNGKYVQTNFGVYELKYFFSEGLETDSGEDISSREVKARLQEIVDNEDKTSPLSDKALADCLKNKGYKVARRTISKYREQLNIPVARLRKQIV